MNESSISPARHFSACASLAALGVQVRHLDLFGPIREAREGRPEDHQAYTSRQVV